MVFVCVGIVVVESSGVCSIGITFSEATGERVDRERYD